MGLKIAVANGNWSNPATWNAGILPQSGDAVASNNFTVTIDQNINVSLLTNTVVNPTTSTPIMTGYTTPSGVVTASSEYLSANGEAWKAFDNNVGTAWLSANGSGAVGWLAYEFSTSRIITGYTISNPNTPGAFPKDWTFEAWNGTSWVVLHTVTGNTNTGTYSGTFTNTVSYIKYRINITANNGLGSYTSIGEFKMYVPGDSLVASVAGGGFILNGGITIDSLNVAGSGIINGNTTCITFSALGTSVINGRIANSSSISSVNTILFNGNGTLTINGNFDTGESSSRNNILVSGNGILNVTGNLSQRTNSQNIVVNGLSTNNPTINIVGSFSTGGSGSAANLYALSQCTINITGDLPTGINSGQCVLLQTPAACTINITGNLIGNGGSGYALRVASGVPYINITGNISGNPNQGTSYPTFVSGAAHYFTHIGQQIGANGGVAVAAAATTAINLFSGPFICSTYGFMPYLVTRMHLIPSISSYIEFRDETTNGALSPGAVAPSTRLISPASVSNGPAVGDVRLGTIYALGTLIGTLNMPHPNQVTYGVAVDNTFGNAVLTAASVWDYLVSNINTADSIGMRLKNVSTPQTTGEQLEAFLRLD